MKNAFIPPLRLLASVACLCVSLQAAGNEPAPASNASARLSISNPAQSYDVQIGDVLRRQVELTLPAGARLAKDSLPRKGSREAGMELVHIGTQQQTQQGQNRISLQLDYQVFASSAKPSVMQLPALKLQAEGSEEVFDVPAWRFWFSPMVVSNAGKAGSNMQPQFRAQPVETQGLQNALLAFAALALLGALALVYINAERRWLPFMGGAFAHAHRKIRRLKPGADTTRVAFYHMHAAFNTWYGGNCFAQDIDRFVQQNPRFGRSREEIARFFACSNDYLFLDQAQDGGQHREHTMQELKQLSKRFRHCERGVA